MSKITKIKPNDIYSILSRRLSSTNMLWKKREEDNLEQEKVIFFKYYFDISSAIEACLRGIIFVYCNNSLSGNALKAFGRPEDSSVAYFLNLESFKSVTNGDKILLDVSLEKYNDYLKMITCFDKEIVSNKPFESQYIYDIYEQIRKTRNTLAHGLNSMEKNVDFTASHLADFMFIFYIVHNYYKRVHVDLIEE